MRGTTRTARWARSVTLGVIAAAPGLASADVMDDFVTGSGFNSADELVGPLSTLITVAALAYALWVVIVTVRGLVARGTSGWSFFWSLSRAAFMPILIGFVSLMLTP